MKITTNRHDILEAEKSPWRMFLLLLAPLSLALSPGINLIVGGGVPGVLAWIVAGGAVLALMSVFVERVQLRLDARNGTALVRSERMFRARITLLQLDDVLRAETQMRVVRSKVYRTVLIATDRDSGREKTVPVSEIYRSGRGAARLTGAINGWLQGQAIWFRPSVIPVIRRANSLS